MTKAGGEYKEILFEIKNKVAWISINRPEVRNAFREQTLDEMRHAVLSTRNDPSIVCVVIRGVGDKAFSAGGDFHAMMRIDWQNAAHWNDRMLGLAMACRGIPIPVVAMVHGYCMGGGHELALWCDLVIAADDAVFGQSGAVVGACPTVGATQYLPQLIGSRLAKEMIFMARRFTAQEAVNIGLINRVVPKADLESETQKWCEGLIERSGQTMRMVKKSLNHDSDALYASWQHGMELLAHVWGTDECMEGMNAFLEKRKPDFQQFREMNKENVENYLDGIDNNENERPVK